MTHLYDTVEPNVISHQLLCSCVLAQGPEGEAGRLAKEEGVQFSEVRFLRLDFQSERKGGGASRDIINQPPFSLSLSLSLSLSVCLSLSLPS